MLHGIYFNPIEVASEVRPNPLINGESQPGIGKPGALQSRPSP